MKPYIRVRREEKTPILTTKDKLSASGKPEAESL